MFAWVGFMEISSNLRAPIVSQEEKIAGWFYSRINGESGVSQTSSCDLNFISKCALGVLELARNAFFIPASLKLPLYIKWPCAVGNLAALTGLDYWAGSAFIDDKIPSETGLEKIFPQADQVLFQKAAHVGNVGLALISQIPIAYPAMQYNKEFAVPAGIIVLIGGAFIPLRSMQLYIDKVFNKKAAQDKGIDVEKQDAFVQLIRDNKQYFINRFASMSEDQQKQFFEDLKSIQTKVDSREKIEAYWHFLLSSREPLVQEELSEISKKAIRSAEVAGYFFSGTFQLASSIYTFVKTKENVFDNNVFAGTVTTLIVGCSLYLEGTATADATVKLVESITGINRRNNEIQESLVEKLRKKDMIVLHVMGHITNVLALGVAYVIWNEFFENEVEKVFFEVTTCIAVFLLLHASTPPLISQLAEWSFLLRNGTPEEKAAVKLSQEYQTLADSIDRISPEDFETFSSILPADLLECMNNEGSAHSEDFGEGISLRETVENNPMLLEEGLREIR